VSVRSRPRSDRSAPCGDGSGGTTANRIRRSATSARAGAGRDNFNVLACEQCGSTALAHEHQEALRTVGTPLQQHRALPDGPAGRELGRALATKLAA
jgi:hypothetical protein